jgi:hypothetical protein
MKGYFFLLTGPYSPAEPSLGGKYIICPAHRFLNDKYRQEIRKV